jgi:hypothetical protein
VGFLFHLFAVHGCVIAPSDLLKALKNLSEDLSFVDGKAGVCLDSRMDSAFLLHSFCY